MIGPRPSIYRGPRQLDLLIAPVTRSIVPTGATRRKRLSRDPGLRIQAQPPNAGTLRSVSSPRVPGEGSSKGCSNPCGHAEAPASRTGVGFGTAGAVEPLSALRCRLREADSRFDALPFDGAVHGGAANTEELGHLEGAVLTTVD